MTIHQEELARLSQQGASKEEQEQILQAHQRDLQNLVNKMDADKLRMQSNLQERLAKRRQEKLKEKEREMDGNKEEKRREQAENQKSQMERLKADEVLSLTAMRRSIVTIAKWKTNRVHYHKSLFIIIIIRRIIIKSGFS